VSGQKTGADATAADATQLALERTYLAHERTLMAWVRTSTSMISFGFTIYKFFQYLRQQGEAPPAHRLIGAREFALIMISIGVVTLLLATLQHWRDTKRLRAQCPEMPFSLASVLAALILGLGVFLLLATILHQ
jgi:putative membrane protein